MEQYFIPKINQLNSRIKSWENKSFFQRLVAKEKWSEEDAILEIEKIFQINSIELIQSHNDFNIYVKYFIEYIDLLPAELSIAITEGLLKSDYLNLEIKPLLINYVNEKKASLHYFNKAFDLIDLIK